MSLNLPTSEELVIEDAELRSILAKIAKRSAGGRAVSGRYNKHDTARLRFIRSIALPGIRFGQLVPDDDMRMLRLGPMNVLHGVDLASMDEWAQRHGRDPRSKKKDGWLDETEQATLFRWLSCNEKHLVVSNSARRGAPRAFQLDFGAYEGHRLEQLVQRLKVLKHPTLLARGDAAGIARATGITTSDRILKALAAELVVEARTRQLLEAHGVLNLAQRTRRTAAAPGAVRPPPAGLAPVVVEEEERGAQGARGPLPLAADVVRLPGAGAADVVATEGPLPAEVAADPQVVLLPVPAAGERDAEGRTRAQVLALNRSRKRTARLTPEAREARNGKRKDRGDRRRAARQRRSGDSEDEGEEEGEEEDE
jgi:hypothetical protein